MGGFGFLGGHVVTHQREQPLYRSQCLKVKVSNRIQSWIQLLESWFTECIGKGKLTRKKAKYVAPWLPLSVIAKMELKEMLSCTLMPDKAQISGSQRLATSFKAIHKGETCGG